MRKVRALLVSALLAGGALVSLNAAPAHAESLRGVFYDYSECQRVGQYGYTQGWWGWWHCEQQYSYYFLYA
ncbi:hypothetical protein MF672_014080 [Actinomadura sp. ATCC 31491]|uniref:Secreted protein n=1 Tax=Actinomadura luzonensis TaxID=2805427 RepID=A0ABT0FSD4_9ACTN|nr:hypothetical protein [Actinomadura luzonensis]MCK2214905.1 hypothetical protein [Actinomadura luzonensis]